MDSNDPESKRRLAKIRYDQGEANSMNGNDAKSLEFHQAGLALRRELLNASRNDLELRYEVTRSMSAIALLKEKAKESAEASVLYRDVVASLEELARFDTKNLQYQYRRADGHESLGRLFHAENRISEALRSQERAKEIREKLPMDDPSMPTVQADLLRSYDWLGFLPSKVGPLTESLLYYEKARTIREKMLQDDPSNAHLRADFITNLGSVTFLLRKLDRLEEAKQIENIRIMKRWPDSCQLHLAKRPRR